MNKDKIYDGLVALIEKYRFQNDVYMLSEDGESTLSLMEEAMIYLENQGVETFSVDVYPVYGNKDHFTVYAIAIAYLVGDELEVLNDFLNSSK